MGGEQVTFYPYKRGRGGGGGTSFRHAGAVFWGSFNMGPLRVLATQQRGWGAKCFHPFKKGGGRTKCCPISRGGGTKNVGPAIFTFCSPLPLMYLMTSPLSRIHICLPGVTEAIL